MGIGLKNRGLAFLTILIAPVFAQRVTKNSTLFFFAKILCTSVHFWAIELLTLDSLLLFYYNGSSKLDITQ